MRTFNKMTAARAHAAFRSKKTFDPGPGTYDVDNNSTRKTLSLDDGVSGAQNVFNSHSVRGYNPLQVRSIACLTFLFCFVVYEWFYGTVRCRWVQSRSFL
jgi:hypothetical protein